MNKSETIRKIDADIRASIKALGSIQIDDLKEEAVRNINLACLKLASAKLGLWMLEVTIGKGIVMHPLESISKNIEKGLHGLDMAEIVLKNSPELEGIAPKIAQAYTDLAKAQTDLESLGSAETTWDTLGQLESVYRETRGIIFTRIATLECALERLLEAIEIHTKTSVTDDLWNAYLYAFRVLEGKGEQRDGT